MDDNNFLAGDDELWQSAISGVTPLKAKEKFAIKEQKSADLSALQERSSTPAHAIHIQAPPLNKLPMPYLAEGDMSRVDGSIAHKLKTGTYPIDATLDLHGRTQDEAWEVLRYFIATAYSMEKRCVLVVTGKGVQGSGVLRTQFPRWLAMAGMEEYILAFTTAIAKHGGDGAFYVLLKKNKQSTKGP